MTRTPSPPADEEGGRRGRPQPPCAVVELPEAFKVVDANGRAVAFVYFATGPRLSAIPGAWTRDEAADIAQRIARGFTRAGTNRP